MGRTATGAWIVAGLIGAAAYIALLDESQPESGVDLDVHRTDALEIAEAFLIDRGYDLTDFDSTVGFQASATARRYIEKNLDADEAQHIMVEESPIYYWLCRWYKPLEKDAFYVWVGTDGRLWGFHRSLLDDVAAETIEPDEAEALARETLAQFEPSAETCVIVAQYTETLPNRTDRYITFTRQDIYMGDAEHRIRVVIQGDEVGSVQPFIYIPEYIERGEDVGQAYRGLLWQLSDLPSSIFEAIVLVIFLIRIRDGKARYGFAVLLGFLAATIASLEEINSWASVWLYYPSTDSPAAFTGELLMGVAETFVSQLVYIAMLAVAADGVWRWTRPNLPALNGVLTYQYWVSQPLFSSAIVGLCAAGIHAGFFSVFYVVGKEWFGVWSPQQSPYHDLMSGAIPWAHPLATGFLAAVREELLYRVVMVGLLLRIIPIRFIAIVIPACIWAFLHSMYPQEPVYIRGLELSAIGILYGAIMLRYGPMATIISHYGYNTLVGGMLLFRSGDLNYQIAGTLVLASTALPLFPGIIRKFRGGTLEELPPQTDEATYEMHLRLPDPHVNVQVTRPLSTKVLALCTALSLIAIVGLGYLLGDDVPWAPPGAKSVVVEVSPQEAEVSARAYAADRGIDLNEYRAAHLFRDHYDASWMDFAYANMPREEFFAVRRDDIPDLAYWFVRFFKPGQEEEWYARVLPNGDTYAMRHALPAEAPGSSLSEEEAREIALDHIESEYDLSPRDWKEVDVAVNDYPNRVDHTFVWERRTIGEGGSLRSSVEVVDGRALNFDAYVHTPETWRREVNESSAREFIGQFVLIVVGLMVLILFGMHSIVSFIHRQTEWRRWLPVAALGTILFLGLRINGWNDMWSVYSTSISPEIFQSQHFIAHVRNSLHFFAATWLSLVFVSAIAKKTMTGPATLGRPSAVGGAVSYFTLAIVMLLDYLNIDRWIDRAATGIPQAPSPRIVGDETAWIPVLQYVAMLSLSLGLVALVYLAIVSIFRNHSARISRVAIVAAIAAAGAAAQADHEWRVVVVCGLATLLATPVIAAVARWIQDRIFGNSLACHAAAPMMAIALLLGLQLLGEPDFAIRFLGYTIVFLHFAITAIGTFVSARLDTP